MTRQQIADAMKDEPDALAVLRRLYPEAAAVNGPEWIGALRQVGWRCVASPVRGAFWSDGNGHCGFVGKAVVNGREFVDHNGTRRSGLGHVFLAVGG